MFSFVPIRYSEVVICKRVFLAVSNPTYREALADILTRMKGIRLVGKVGNGWEVLQLSAQLKPDIILIDSNLTGLTGIEAARAIKKQSSQVSVILLVDDDNEQYIDTESSCKDWTYLTKEHVVEELPGLLDKFKKRAPGENTCPANR